MKERSKVYVSLIADLLHAGHIKVLKEAEKRGDVTVGLLTSTAINELNDVAYLKYEQRKEVIQNLSMVSSVIAQESASYKDNLVNQLLKGIIDSQFHCIWYILGILMS